MSENKSTAAAPGLAIGAQYIKDLSFENQGAQALAGVKDAAPQPQIDFHINTEDQSNGKHLVHLRIIAKLASKDTAIYLLDLTYTGLFMIQGLDTDTLEKVLFIECPRLLFPAARTIVLNITQDSGFPPLYLSPAIDFAGLYAQQKNKNKAAPAPKPGK